MRVEALCKSYGGRTVLENVSFEAGVGVTCLMAPSGSGKTTLLRILLGLETADSGAVYDPPARWSAVFQEDRLLEHLDAMENLRFALGRDLNETAALEMLARLGLDGEGNKAVEDYSGGMKRRLALARALLARSGAVALDEPFTGLDEENRRACLAAVREAGEGRMVLLVTHDEADAAALGASILRLRPPLNNT